VIQVQAKLVGICPLLMHNGRLNNPFDPITVALRAATSKNKGKNKTEDGAIEISRIEFNGGLVTDENGAPAINQDMLIGCWTAGAKKLKEGKNLPSALWVTNAFFPIEYDGPKDAAGLWNDKAKRFIDFRRAGVQGSGIMRTRPIFREWSCVVVAEIDETLMDPDRAIECLEQAGMRCGIGDYRPRFGRFHLEDVVKGVQPAAKAKKRKAA
jgi:hypothetical protein